jgi:hypothetical protein
MSTSLRVGTGEWMKTGKADEYRETDDNRLVAIVRDNQPVVERILPHAPDSDGG